MGKHDDAKEHAAAKEHSDSAHKHLTEASEQSKSQ